MPGLSLVTPDLSVNLYDGPFRVYEEWTPEVADGDDLVSQSIPLLALGSDDAISAAVRDVNRCLRLGAEYVDDESQVEYCVLRLTPDTGRVQETLVYRGRLAKGLLPGVNFRRVGGVPYTLELMNHPLWEPPFTELANNGVQSDISSYGGRFVFSNIDGDDPARIVRLNFKAATGAGFDPTDMWIGFKQMEIGFEGEASNWDCRIEMGSVSGNIIDTSDTTRVNDTTRSQAWYYRCSFSTDATLQPRARGTLVGDGSGDVSFHRGRYLVLAAMRVGSGVTAGVQLRMGYYGALAQMPYATWVPNPEVLVTNTTWDVIPLGYVQLPPFFPAQEDYVDAAPFPELNFGIWAERLAGSGNLEWDDLILVPSKHMAAITDTATASPWPQELVIASRKDDRYIQHGGGWLDPEYPGTLSVNNFGVPTRTSVMVVVADQKTYNESLLVDDIIISQRLFYQPRWRNYRAS